jgi:hypothetical protein
VAQLGQTINMASAAFQVREIYHPSVNGLETMDTPGFEAETPPIPLAGRR